VACRHYKVPIPGYFGTHPLEWAERGIKVMSLKMCYNDVDIKQGSNSMGVLKLEDLENNK